MTIKLRTFTGAFLDFSDVASGCRLLNLSIPAKSCATSS